MGKDMLLYYQTKIKKEYRFAFWFTFLFTLFVHLYKFVNTLPNHDSVYNYYSDQNVLGSGRWALSIACGFSSYYDLPWVIGILSCVFIALTVVVITALFKLKNPVLIALSGALLASSPSTTETFFFLFTADGYMIAMFLAALTAYWSRIEEKRTSRFILSGICICVSCGIYQAYVSFALVLSLCYFMIALLENNHTKKEYTAWIWRQVVLYPIFLLLYYMIWKLCLHITGTAASNYQGISQIGTINLGIVLSGFIRSIKSVLLYFLQFNILEHGLPLYSFLNIVFLVAAVIGLIIACAKSRIFQRRWALILLLLCLAAIIPSACIWHFTSNTVGYRAMMLQSLTLLFISTALLYEKWASLRFKNTICLFLILISLHNGLMANIAYFHMQQCYERTYAEGIEMMIDIHDMQNSYRFDKVAFIGTRIFDVQYESFGHQDNRVTSVGTIHILSSLLEETLLFDSEHTALFLKGTMGLDLDVVSSETLLELSNLDCVRELDCWPASSSMIVIDDVLVIKLSDNILN